MVDEGNGYYSFDGNLYKSDIVRAAIRPKVYAVGKAVPKHIRTGPDDKVVVNPKPYLKMLLEEPNPLMSGQVFQEKMTAQLELNNNAFAYIYRNENGLPLELYPINSILVRFLRDEDGGIFLSFILKNGKQVIFRYADVIHLRKDFYSNDIFGDSGAVALAPLMEVITTVDQGIVKAIKNSNVIKWLLNSTKSLNKEDMNKLAKDFRDSFLSGESESTGVAVTDSKTAATQITPTDFVPNAAQTDRYVERIHSYFNTNKKIVQSDFSEQEGIVYHESAVEPTIIQMAGEYSRKLFSRTERSVGNKIVFDGCNTAYASLATIINLKEMVDRGALTPNEWRKYLNASPVPGGDEPIRRLDTRPTSE